MKRYSVMERPTADFLASGPVVDVTVGCFRRVSCSTSVGMDASVMTWCTSIQREDGQIEAEGKSGKASNFLGEKLHAIRIIHALDCW